MVFSSALFVLYFLPVFLLGYHLMPGIRAKNLSILLFSALFYAWGAPVFIFVILASTIVDFYIVRQMHQSTDARKRKRLLITSLVLNLSLLGFFKYANFFIENTNEVLTLLGVKSLGWTEIALPIGISFYTFQTLTYAIDIYRREQQPLERLTDYLLYILSFPQMIAGPIVRFGDVAKEITHRKEDIDEKLVGVYRFCIGLAKKVLIANVMAHQAHFVFDNDYNQLITVDMWVGMIAYTFQIYFDFSGYSDMAIGLGKIVGFTFPENFNLPYISGSITEFWRRWHITLGNFMRDYLYIPLGGNRVTSKPKVYRNLLIVFLLSGLWHGASWNYVIWGAYHGIFLILDRLFLVRFMTYVGRVPAIMITFFITMVGWVIFKIEDLDRLWVYLKKLFVFEGGWQIDVIPEFYAVLCVAIFFSFVGAFRFGERWKVYFFEKNSYSLRASVSLMALSLVLLICSLSSLLSSGFNPFIYYRF